MGLGGREGKDVLGDRDSLSGRDGGRGTVGREKKRGWERGTICEGGREGVGE